MLQLLASPELRDEMRTHIRGMTWVLLVLLLAFGLRMFRLGNQPLWSDEIYSVAVARHSASDVAGWVYRDNHPALYWFVLYPVVRLLGDDAILVRFPSAFMGTLTIALTYAAGKAILKNHRVAVFPALWLTVSPIHIVYSQEARMYAQLALFGIASTYFLYRGAARGGWLNWLLYGVTAGATAHSHNYGLLLAMAQGLWGLFLLLRSRNRRLMWGSALSLATFALLYAPMLPALMTQVDMRVGSTGVATSRDIVGFLEAFGAGFTGFSTPGLTPGPLIEKTAPPTVVVTIALLVLGSLGTNGERKLSRASVVMTKPRVSLLLTLCCLFPVVFAYGYSAAMRKAIWQVRGFQMALGCFALLVGAGLGNVRPRFLRAAVFLSLMTVSGVNLYPHYFERYKSTVPDAVAGLEGRLDSQDVLFVAPHWDWTPFRYYYRGDADAIGGRKEGEVIQFAGVARDYADVIDSRSLHIQSETTEPIVAPNQFNPDHYARVWTISHWATPQRVVELFGDDITVMHYDVETQRWRAVLYPVGTGVSSLPANISCSSLAWDNGLRLLGHRWHTTPVVGERTRLALFWATEEPQSRRSYLRVQLLDERGEVALEHQVPMLSLVNGLPMTALGIRSTFATTAWPTGSIVAQEVKVDVPPNLPPVFYELHLQVVDETTGAPVPILGKRDGVLETISVSRPAAPTSPRAVEVQHRQNVSFGGQIRLIGYDLPEAPPRPGHHLPIWLHWAAERAPSSDYEVQLRLVDDDGAALSQTRGAPSDTPFPTSRWQNGDLALGRFNLRLPPDATGGRYQLFVRVVDSATGHPVSGKQVWSLRPRDWVLIAQAEILDWPLITDAPQMDHPVSAEFGNAAQLLGYDLLGDPSPGAELSITLYWRAQRSLDHSYHVFLHLDDARGELTAQADGIPANWLRPTTTWRRDEIIIDEHRLELPAELPEGEYHLYAGLYEPEGLRLPIVSQTQPVDGGRVLLRSLEMKASE